MDRYASLYSYSGGEDMAPACGAFGVEATGVYGISSGYTANKFQSIH